MIYRYSRVSVPGPTGTVHFHRAATADQEPVLTELATLDDGYTYCALAPDAELPEQPQEVALEPVTLHSDLHDALAKASPALRRINAEVVKKIRSQYSVEDEIKMLRLAPSDETTQWNLFVEECRQWGRDQRAALGFE